jgi:hypothetical protein
MKLLTRLLVLPLSTLITLLALLSSVKHLVYTPPSSSPQYSFTPSIPNHLTPALKPLNITLTKPSQPQPNA